jgi:hypothetical protein
MDDIRLLRHVIDRLENRWASRLARAWSSDKASPSSPATSRPAAPGSFPLPQARTTCCGGRKFA